MYLLSFKVDYGITDHLIALTGKIDGDPLSGLAPEVLNDKKYTEKVSHSITFSFFSIVLILLSLTQRKMKMI
jgi:hypothetical protein